LSIKKEIANWGNFPKVDCNIEFINNVNEPEIYASNDYKVIARGNGRCYGDASLGEHIIQTTRLTNFLDFNAEEGFVECESGVMLSDLLEFLVPRSFFLPVTPGTKFITIGGAIAADVHGKNHHKDGCFSNFVKSFKIWIGPGRVIECSRKLNTEHFFETIGGMGLTGIILSAKFDILPITSSYIYQETIKAKNIDEIFQLFDESEDWTYTVAWIDCLKKGRNLGRSVLMRGEWATIDQLKGSQKKNPLKVHEGRKLDVPIYMPSFVLNSLSVKLFNWWYFHKQLKKLNRSVVHYDTFFYPLDKIGHWNRIYGKPGFIQYQFVIPLEDSNSAMKEILSTIAISGQGSFLAVLKLFGKNDPKCYNSFPIEGYTLALDFKQSKKLKSLIEKLDSIVIKFGGRIYRAKDSISNPKLTNYITITEGYFDSIQNQRINSKI